MSEISIVPATTPLGDEWVAMTFPSYRQAVALVATPHTDSEGSRMIACTAAEDGRPAGLGLAQLPKDPAQPAEILSLFVRADLRNQGVGTGLIEALEGAARAEGRDAIMAKWDAALNARKLLKPASYDAMWTPFTFNDGKKSSYGFGWQLEPYRTRPRQAHDGGITGFSTFIARYPEEKVTVIALVNQDGEGGGVLANGIADLFVPGLKALAPRPIADADPETTAFLKKVITAAAGGTAEADWFTPEFRSFMLPDRIKQGPQMFGRFGPLQAFELMEDATRDGRRVRAYRAMFGSTSLRATFTLAPDGKIAGLGVQPDN